MALKGYDVVDHCAGSHLSAVLQSREGARDAPFRGLQAKDSIPVAMRIDLVALHN